VNLYGEFPKHKGTRENGEEKRLATFIGNIRQKKKLNKVAESRIRDLETIPGFSWQDRSKPNGTGEFEGSSISQSGEHDDDTMAMI